MLSSPAVLTKESRVKKSKMRGVIFGDFIQKIVLLTKKSVDIAGRETEGRGMADVCALRLTTKATLCNVHIGKHLKYTAIMWETQIS